MKKNVRIVTEAARHTDAATYYPIRIESWKGATSKNAPEPIIDLEKNKAVDNRERDFASIALCGMEWYNIVNIAKEFC